jgi:putative transcriptional regulator
MENSLLGKIIISTPHIGDTRFAQSVIFICAHDENGAMGLVINKPLIDLDLGDLLKDLKIDTGSETKIKMPVYMGGPLEPERGFLLHSHDHNRDDSTTIGANFGVSGSLEALKSVTKQEQLPKDMVFALGYAGWDANELEKEIKEDAWFVTDADLDLVFGQDRDKLWTLSMSRLGVNPHVLTGQIGQA